MGSGFGCVGSGAVVGGAGSGCVVGRVSAWRGVIGWVGWQVGVASGTLGLNLHCVAGVGVGEGVSVHYNLGFA